MFKMLVYDWYDGPIGGLVDLDGACYRFFLLDWDSCHRIRIFGLQEISGSIETAVARLTTNEPKWPVWFPANFVDANRNARQWAEEILSQRISAERIDRVLVWDSASEACLKVASVPSELAFHTDTWFDSIDSSEKIDWIRAIQ